MAVQQLSTEKPQMLLLAHVICVMPLTFRSGFNFQRKIPLPFDRPTAQRGSHHVSLRGLFPISNLLEILTSVICIPFTSLSSSFFFLYFFFNLPRLFKKKKLHIFQFTYLFFFSFSSFFFFLYPSHLGHNLNTELSFPLPLFFNGRYSLWH